MQMESLVSSRWRTDPDLIPAVDVFVVDDNGADRSWVADVLRGEGMDLAGSGRRPGRARPARIVMRRRDGSRREHAPLERAARPPPRSATGRTSHRRPVRRPRPRAGTQVHMILQEVSTFPRTDHDLGEMPEHNLLAIAARCGTFWLLPGPDRSPERDVRGRAGDEGATGQECPTDLIERSMPVGWREIAPS